MDVTAKEVASRLAARVEAVCAYLLPGGKKQGHEWIDDPGTGKIKVELQGAKAGLWNWFGGDDEKGDLLDLFAFVRCNKDLGQAYKEALAWLGIETPKFAGSKERKSYKRPEKPAATKPATKGTQVEDYLRCTRGLYNETIEAFRIMEAEKMEGKREDGSTYAVPGPWILFPYFRPEKDHTGKPVLANIKWLHVERDKDGKKRTKQESGAQPTLFGWHALPPGAKSVTLTEGELDAATVHQWGHPALSLPQGAGTGAKQNWISEDFDDLARFETIYLWMDADSEGQKTIPELVSRLGAHRCRIIRLPEGCPFKDANEVWTKGGWTKAQVDAIYEMSKYLDPAEMKNAAAFTDQVIEEFYPSDKAVNGMEMPWKAADILRLRPGQVTMLTGINSHGKSQILNQIITHLADRGHRICIYSGEIAAKKTLAIMVRQVAMVETPRLRHIEGLMDWLDGKVWIYDVKGKVDRAKLLEHFRYARRRWGIDLFIIDSLMKCGIALDDYQCQSDFTEQLTEFADVEGCHLVLVAHPAKPKDESRPVGRLGIKGSGDVSDKAHVCLEVWRDKGKEKKVRDIERDGKLSYQERIDKIADIESKPDTKLIIDKQRETGREGEIHLWFNSAAMAWTDSRGGDLPAYMTVPAAPLDVDAF